MGVLQTIFCVFNGLVSLLAAVCVGVGVWALVDGASFTKNFDKATAELQIDSFSAADVQRAAIMVIVVGTLIMLIAGIGCCGAKNDSKCLLGVFFISMLVICVLVVVAVILVSLYPGKLKTEMREKFTKFINDDNKEFEKFVDNFQSTFKCCGIEGPADYDKKTVPNSCYEDADKSKTQFKDGCVTKISKELQDVQSPMFITAIVTLVLLLLATAISGYLYCRAGEGHPV